MVITKHTKSLFIISSLVIVFSVVFLTSPSVFAACAEDSVETNFFGCVEDNGEGCGVWIAINLILTVLTFGVAIAGTVGLVITAIMYLTARDNTNQVTKAKKRILEIVIGLAIYAAMWSIASWLIPGGIFSSGELCKTSTPTAGFSNPVRWNSTSNGNGDDSNDNEDSGDINAKNDSTLDDPNAKITGTKKYEKKINAKPFKLKISGPNKLKYKSSNKRVAYVTSDGTVYPNDIGTAKITVSSGQNTFTTTVKVTKRTSKPTIGEAAHGNNGAGDQSGDEVHTRKWYGYGRKYDHWNYVFRFKNPVKAEEAADDMIATCKNNNVGYDNRSPALMKSFTVALRKAKWDPNKVTKKCTTTCDRVVAAMVQAVGFNRDEDDWKPGDLGGAPGLAKLLKKDSTNFYTIKDSSYTKKWNKLRRGDIIIDSEGGQGYRHVIMVVK